MLKRLSVFYRRWQSCFLALLTLAVFVYCAVYIFGVQATALGLQFVMALCLLLLMMLLAFSVVYLLKKYRSKRR